MSDIYYKVAHRSQAEIDSFAGRYETFDQSVIPVIFQHDLNLKVENIRQSTSWGSSHVIYFVQCAGQTQELVFRANNGASTPEVVMVIEKLITDKVSKLGLSTNTILHVDVSRSKYNFDYQIEELLKGEDPEANFSGTQADYDQLSFDLGVYIGKYSQIQFPLFGLFDEQAALAGELKGTKSSFYEYLNICLDSDLDMLEAQQVLTAIQTKQIREIFTDHRNIIKVAQGVLVHHDLADHNLMYDPQSKKFAGVFDWEAAVSGDVVLDLASCPTWKTLYPREEHLIAGFRTVQDLPEYFTEKMNLYKLRTVLWKTVYCIRRNILTPERTAKMGKVLAPYRI